MTEIESRVRSAWQQASRDLGIQFSTPHVVTALNGVRHACLGLVHHFGRGEGTVITMISSDCPYPPHDSSEYYVSLLSDSYADYDRQLFIETLSDWGWCGALDQRPSWLAEEP